MGRTAGSLPIWDAHPESVDALRDALGRKLTAREAAEELSERYGVAIERCAIIGKASRLGIPINGASRRTPQRKPREVMSGAPAVPAPVNALSAPSAPSAPPEPVGIPHSRRVSLMSLRRGMCRWPIGDPRAADFSFCGASGADMLADPARPYCAEHALIAYVGTARINKASMAWRGNPTGKEVAR